MRFTATQLALDGVLLINPQRIEDSRGYFMETYRARTFEDFGLPAIFVQDNEAFSAAAGTIRGLHFQTPPYAQAKLVRAVHGSLFDVAVDLRRGSPTFGRWVGVTLSAANGHQLFVPHGFAHGYCALEPATTVAYKCDRYYAAEADAGILFSDPAIGIEWPVPIGEAVVSRKDLALPLLGDVASPFAMELS
jgi:dTDP-4-dehydrorhamnose 3,5-epimerase